MILSIVFTEENPQQPFVRISIREGEAAIKLTRWVQFLALLAYRRLRDIQNGWVQREELCRLISFNGIEPKAIGRYIADTHARFPDPIYKFVSRYLNITTTGPYALMLSQDKIAADLPKLEQYLSWIMEIPSPEEDNPEYLFGASMAAHDRHEYLSALALMKQFLAVAESQPSIEPDAAPVGYFHMANILKDIEGDRFSGGQYIQKGVELIREIKSAPIKKRLNVYANIITADTLDVNKCFAERIKLNTKTTELVQANMRIPYSHSILFGRFMDNIWQIFNYEKTFSTKDFKYIIDLSKSGPDFKLIEILEFLKMIIQTEITNECASATDIDWFNVLLNRGRSPNRMLFGMGWKMRSNLIKFNQLEAASQVGQECLLEFSNLHQMAAYRSRLAEHKKLVSVMNPKMSMSRLPALLSS